MADVINLVSFAALRDQPNLGNYLRFFGISCITYIIHHAGMCHTVIWDVQYSKIRVKYGIRV